MDIICSWSRGTQVSIRLQALYTWLATCVQVSCTISLSHFKFLSFEHWVLSGFLDTSVRIDSPPDLLVSEVSLSVL